MFGCCGIDCDRCPEHPARCQGCDRPNNDCPVRKCCNEKGFVHCGPCPDLPCSRYYDGVNASYSEEYERAIRSRIPFSRHTDADGD